LDMIYVPQHGWNVIVQKKETALLHLFKNQQDWFMCRNLAGLS
jgi:imidazoleglycerol phosphate synthase glutamine amidotransferase subunit HisH